LATLIDTSVFIDLERRGSVPSAALAHFENGEGWIAAITASELLHGVHRATSIPRRLARKAFVDEILARFPPVPFDLSVARVHAELWADLARRGRLIGAHDLQIAATALTVGSELLTANRAEFERVDGLRVLTWPLAAP
jgi:tRNA(fMet)-specific endonuclease VapC